jgi:adhesin transport system membrane fusion protein
MNQAKQEYNQIQGQLEGLLAAASALVDRLDRTSVRSPVYGTIKQILVNTVGGVVQPGMNLVEIVPLEDSLLIEAQIKPADIAFLTPKQRAMVKFTAYDFTIYGGLEAELEQISADSTTDERGNSYYLVRLRTKQNYLQGKTGNMPIIPGMVTVVDIVTGKKTILSYLLKPVLRAKQMALRER